MGINKDFLAKLDLIKTHPQEKLRSFSRKNVSNTHKQGTFNWRASSYPDFIHNYFSLKRMFDFFDIAINAVNQSF